METLSKEEFTALAAAEAATCVSIFIPVHRSGVEVNENLDAITLKAKLQQAERTLAEKGTDQDTIDRLLKGGMGLVEQRDFWNSMQSDGLALFMSDGFFKYVKLPFAVKEEVLVDSSFYVTPLVPLLNNKDFYLLVLSRDDSSLYRGDAYGLSEVQVTGLPQKLNTGTDEEGRRRILTGAGAGSHSYEEERTAGESEDTLFLVQSLKKADQALAKEEASSVKKPPVLLAGTGYLVENFRKLSQYPNIAGEVLEGDFEQTDRDALYRLAKEKLASYFKEDTSKALKAFYENSSTELTSSIPDEVIQASYDKKVSDLFVQKDEHLWGVFNEAANQPVIHPQADKLNTCLLNKAVIKTILNGGAVHILEKDKMPADSKIAAFMRY